MPPSTPPHISTSVKPYDRPAQVSSPTAPVPYIFDFGLQKGEPFSSISASTLNWIFRSFYYRKKPALKAALISHGFMNPDGSRTSKRPPPTPRKKKDAVPLLVPDTIPARNPNKAYTMQGGQDIWITRRAVDEHFGIGSDTLRQAGLHVEEGNTTGSKNYWLWQVVLLAPHVPASVKSHRWKPKTASACAQEFLDSTGSFRPQTVMDGVFGLMGI